MKELSKKILISISYAFSFLIFAIFFLLVNLQFKEINLSPVTPIINKILISNKIINQNMKLNGINIFFERNDKRLKIDSSLMIHDPSFDKWVLGLDNYLAINLNLSKHEEDFITFKISNLIDLSQEKEIIKKFNLYGNLIIFEDFYKILLTGEAENLPLSLVKVLWPENLGKGAREWTVKSLYNGSIKRLDIKSDFLISKDGYLKGKPILDFNFTFINIDTFYLKDLPPITETEGIAHLDFDSFHIILDRGIIKLDDKSIVKLDTGRFDAFEIRKKHGPAQVKIKSIANTGYFFKLLSEHKKIKKLLYLDEKILNGDGALDLQFNFPLKKDLRFSETKTILSLTSKELKIYNMNKEESVFSESVFLKLSNHKDKKGYFSGNIKADQLKILQLPIFAQILDISLPSLSNISDGGRDISFSQSLIDFELSYKNIKILEAVIKPESNLPVVGNSLGISLSGNYVFENKYADFSGTIVPVSWINNLPSNVPILGELFSGSKEGEGLFGVKFSVLKENENDLKIEANPLSVLTPGIFQRIFD
ncbi:MAG: hypothetical protein VX847_05640 [Pseudomonadota bacterium]|nr:hypothetical protein [Pseudomonadota bacterium]